jgi:hypothetical protein
VRASAIRAISVLVALVACAWFVIGIRQARSVSEVTSIIGQGRPLSPAQVRHANALLDTAGTLNPDIEVQLLRGEVALRAGRRARAEQIFKAAARQEPDNVEPWLWVARGAGSDASTALLALHTIVRLVPRVSPTP